MTCGCNKACNLDSIGGLFPDGAKALPEPSSMPYLSSTVTIELNVDTHVSAMSKINPVMLLCLFWDCRPLTLCMLELAPVVNWVLTIEFMSALRTCDLNLGCCKRLEICRAFDNESAELPTRFKPQDNHDDVIKWKKIPRKWPFVRGIHRSRWIPRTKASDAELWFFFDVRLNKRLSEQPWGWWFETPSWSLWRQCNGFWEMCFINSLWPVNTATSLNYVNIGVGSGLVPDGARSLPESFLMYHHQLGTYHQSAWSGPVNWMGASRMPQLYPVMLQCLFWKGRPLIFL